METGVATGHVHHMRLTVTDVARSRAFYTDLLGFELVTELGSGVILGNGSLLLGLGPPPFPERAIRNDLFDENRVGLDHLSFRVESRDDLERAERLFEENGVPHSEIVDLGPGFGIYVLVFRDPANIQLELSAPHA